MSEPRRALIVVDVQNDFVEGGSLAVQGGRDVAAAISDHLERHGDAYVAVVATRDTHDAHGTNGGHFAAPGTEPDWVDTWPVHCVVGTSGHDYAPELATERLTHHVRKGMGVPAYSGFQGVASDHRTLADLLADLEVTDLDVVGLATDHCVRATVLDGRAHGFGVRVLAGLHAGVAPGTVEAALAQMTSVGAEVDVEF